MIAHARLVLCNVLVGVLLIGCVIAIPKKESDGANDVTVIHFQVQNAEPVPAPELKFRQRANGDLYLDVDRAQSVIYAVESRRKARQGVFEGDAQPLAATEPEKHRRGVPHEYTSPLMTFTSDADSPSTSDSSSSSSTYVDPYTAYYAPPPVTATLSPSPTRRPHHHHTPSSSSSSSDDDDNNTGLYVAIGMVIGLAIVFVCGVILSRFMTMRRL